MSHVMPHDAYWRVFYQAGQCGLLEFSFIEYVIAIFMILSGNNFSPAFHVYEGVADGCLRMESPAVSLFHRSGGH